MTFEETREFYHPYGDVGRKHKLSFRPDKAEINLPFEDSVGPVHVTVSLTFLPSAHPGPESNVCQEEEDTLSSVYISFQSRDYETLKEIFIERYGKPTSSRQEPYQTQGGAISTDEILTWKGPHSFINLSRFGTSITHGSVLMGTNEALAASSKKREEAIKRGAKGL
jgi:hypothetical protein